MKLISFNPLPENVKTQLHGFEESVKNVEDRVNDGEAKSVLNLMIKAERDIDIGKYPLKMAVAQIGAIKSLEEKLTELGSRLTLVKAQIISRWFKNVIGGQIMSVEFTSSDFEPQAVKKIEGKGNLYKGLWDADFMENTDGKKVQKFLTEVITQTGREKVAKAFLSELVQYLFRFNVYRSLARQDLTVMLQKDIPAVMGTFSTFPVKGGTMDLSDKALFFLPASLTAELLEGDGKLLGLQELGDRLKKANETSRSRTKPTAAWLGRNLGDSAVLEE